jgi:hypothetical protein
MRVCATRVICSSTSLSLNSSLRYQGVTMYQRSGLELLMWIAAGVLVTMLVLGGCASTRVLHSSECLVLVEYSTITTVGHGCTIERRSR